MIRFPRSSALVLCTMTLSLLASQGRAQPSYEEDMARQREQERQNMEQAREAAEWEAADSSDDGIGDWSGSSFYSPPPQPSYNWIARSAELKHEEHEKRLASDPTYRSLSQGVWTFHQSQLGDPRPMCIATFWTLKGGVTMIHWGGKDDITMLGFFGGIIPKPAKTEMVQLVLTQSGETQSVRAFNMRFGPQGELGMFVFLVPSAKALLNSIEDKQDFQIDYQGVTAANGEWHSGLKAKSEMSKCLASQSGQAS